MLLIGCIWSFFLQGYGATLCPIPSCCCVKLRLAYIKFSIQPVVHTPVIEHADLWTKRRHPDAVHADATRLWSPRKLSYRVHSSKQSVHLRRIHVRRSSDFNVGMSVHCRVASISRLNITRSHRAISSARRA